jgi:hypothetical protein
MQTARNALTLPEPPSPRKGGNSQSEAFNPYRQFTGIFIPEGLCRRTDIRPTSKLIYGRLARFAGADGWCYPSVETLAAEVGIELRQARRGLQELETAGLIVRDFQPGQTTRYRFTGRDQLVVGKPPRSEMTALVDREEPESGGVRTETTGGAGHIRPGSPVRYDRQRESTRESSKRVNNNGVAESAEEDGDVVDLAEMRELLFSLAAMP